MDELTGIGWDGIETHETQLAARLRQGLAAIGGVRLLGPALSSRHPGGGDLHGGGPAPRAGRRPPQRRVGHRRPSRMLLRPSLPAAVAGRRSRRGRRGTTRGAAGRPAADPRGGPGQLWPRDHRGRCRRASSTRWPCWPRGPRPPSLPPGPDQRRFLARGRPPRLDGRRATGRRRVRSRLSIPTAAASRRRARALGLLALVGLGAAAVGLRGRRGHPGGGHPLGPGLGGHPRARQRPRRHRRRRRSARRARGGPGGDGKRAGGGGRRPRRTDGGDQPGCGHAQRGRHVERPGRGQRPGWAWSPTPWRWRPAAPGGRGGPGRQLRRRHGHPGRPGHPAGRPVGAGRFRARCGGRRHCRRRPAAAPGRRLRVRHPHPGPAVRPGTAPPTAGPAGRPGRPRTGGRRGRGERVGGGHRAGRRFRRGRTHPGVGGQPATRSTDRPGREPHCGRDRPRRATAWVTAGADLVPVPGATLRPGTAWPLPGVAEAVALAGGRTAWVALQNGTLVQVNLPSGSLGTAHRGGRPTDRGGAAGA